MSQTPAIEISGLWKHYDGNPVVKDLNLEVRPGEIVGLLGPNGAGKSTTINLISGVARMERGVVRVFGHDNQRDFRTTRKIVGVMHQEIIIDPFFKIGRALKLHSGLYGCNDDPDWRNLLIEQLDLRPHLEKRINKLSGGMKRRLMVAKAMIHKPRVLILDEPTAGVDVELRRTMWKFVREINESGTTVVLTTHYLEEAEQMCDRIAIMNHGELVALEATKKLMKYLDQRKVQVFLRKASTEVSANLKPFDPKVLEEGKIWEFSLKPEQDTGEILHWLYEQGHCVSDVKTQTPNLEEVFLQLTSRTKPRERDKTHAKTG